MAIGGFGGASPSNSFAHFGGWQAARKMLTMRRPRMCYSFPGSSFHVRPSSTSGCFLVVGERTPNARISAVRLMTDALLLDLRWGRRWRAGATPRSDDHTKGTR